MMFLVLGKQDEFRLLMPDAIHDQIRRIEMEIALLAEMTESNGFVSDVIGDIADLYRETLGLDDEAELDAILASCKVAGTG